MQLETSVTDVPSERAAELLATTGSMIVFEDVSKIYEPDVVALDHVSFGIDKGEFVFIVGASGSGKTTLVRLLLKELDATSGKIIIGGRDIARLQHRRVSTLRRQIGCVFQDFKLLPSRTAADNVAYALKVQGESRASIRRKVPEVLTMVGLATKMNSYPRRALGRRAAARLDRARRRQPSAAPRLRRADGEPRPRHERRDHAAPLPHQPAGTTILMVTHDREMVDKMRKRVIALEDGRLSRDERRGGYTSE